MTEDAPVASAGAVLCLVRTAEGDVGPLPAACLPPPERWQRRLCLPTQAASVLRDERGRGWQAVVLIDQLPGADLLALLEAVDNVLGEGEAVLLLADRFSRRAHAGAGRVAPSLEHVSALLRRMGWDLEEHAHAPKSAQGVAQLAEDAVQTELRATLIGHRRRRPSARLVRVDAAKAEAMRVLFARVFGEPMSGARWEWKYGGGRGTAVGLCADGELVAHYGGFTRRVRFHGLEALACQVGDVMVLPSANRSLSRAGPMTQVGATFAALEVGYGLPHLVGFGFPNARAFRVAERLGLYAQVDEVVQLQWNARPRTVSSEVRCERIDLQALSRAAVARAIDRCWAAMAAALCESIVGVRDTAWLRDRYLSHPELTYEVWRVRSRWLRRDLGLLVLRRHEQHVELLDLIGAPGHFAALVERAWQRTAELGLSILRCWITRSHLHCLLPEGACADDGGASPCVVDIGVRVPTTIQTEGPPLERLRGRWWLMGGDADFS